MPIKSNAVIDIGSILFLGDIDFITISSSGGGFEFGDLSTARRGPSSLSDSHGGLGGF